MSGLDNLDPAPSTAEAILEWTWDEFAASYEFGDPHGLSARMRGEGLDAMPDEVEAALAAGVAGEVVLRDRCGYALRKGRLGWRWQRK